MLSSISPMASPPHGLVGLFLLVLIMVEVPENRGSAAAASWCISRSMASERVLQKALDCACGAGIDCAAILPGGLCYLPNTVQSHAAYAFNSYYQMSRKAPSSCDFSGLAIVASSDPSYGSCLYPSSATSNVGGTSPATPTTTSTDNSPITPVTASPVGGFSPVGPVIPNAEPSSARRLDFSQIPVLELLLVSLSTLVLDLI